MKRLNKLKGMYALLIAVAACIGITIYASCSADEDYDNYSTGDELFTLADGEMSLRSDVGGGNAIIYNRLSPQLNDSNIVIKMYKSNGSYLSSETTSISYFIKANSSLNQFKLHNITLSNTLLQVSSSSVKKIDTIDNTLFFNITINFRIKFTPELILYGAYTKQNVAIDSTQFVLQTI